MSSFGAGASRSDGGDGGPAETGGGILAGLHELQRLLGSGDPGSCAAALGLLRSLGEECVISAPGSSVLALNTSLVFSKEYGLLVFIHKSLIMEEYRDCREEALKFLVTFLEKIGQHSQPYALEIKKICVIAYTKEKYAKCKVAALDLLIKLLQLLKKSYIIEEFKISELFNKFYGELANKTKLSDTVLEKIYELLGILGEVQPSDMLNNSEKLFRAYLGELKGQMTSSTRQPKFAVVAGCLRGLSALLINFTKSVEEDPSTSKEIFEYTMKAINPQIDLKRYAVPLAGLHLLALHASQFDTYLMDAYQTVFEVMSKWCGHSNHEMKKNAFVALDSFLKQIALLVTNDAGAHKDKLQFFMGQFYKIMRKMESSNKELAIAIRGYGLFAAPCKAVNATDVNVMYIELIQRCKQMYLTEVETEDDNVYQLPNFLQAIASVILYMDSIPEIYTPVLERLLVVQIETFPQYSPKMQFSCSRSIIKVFLSLSGKGPVLWSLISTVVHQGLIRVCSKPVRFEKDGFGADSSQDPSASGEVRAGKWKVPSFKDYLDLFHNLLNCDQIKDSIFSDEVFPALNSPLQSLSRLLYDELIKSILKIIEKLDLSLQKQESGQLVDEDQLGYLVIATSDPAANLYPTKPKDFTAFVNLVDFCSEIIPNKHLEFFEPWVYVFGYEIVLKSTRLPLISGFYRLLSVVMKNAKKLKYFEGVSLNSSGKCPQNPEKISCFALFLKFGKEVSSKMKQFKDELLASCLTFILSLPPDIIKHDMKAYIPSLQMAFKLGLSFPPLADAGLDALDDWSSQIPSDIEKFYKDILPSLDSYLTDTSSSEESLSALDVDRLSRASQKGFNKYLIKQIQRTKSLSVKDDSSLAAVRNRVVRLLGSLGGHINRSLVTATSTEEMIKKHVSWDTEKRLSFAVPFADMKPVIYLDTFLPRVTELALSASDRQTKVAACELLHSMVTFMLGKASQIPDAREGPPPMYRLYKHTFPVLLCLACDVDQVTRQLYEPLVMGIIHWFTNNKKFESHDTVALLDSILDGIVDPGNSTLRDFSGRCIQEFLKWSIKQTTPRQQERSPVNTQSLFKRLYSLALHPNAFKRLGAALAFNNVYKEFREEDALVEKFVFEILIVYMQSLALCHGDEKSLGTIQQCSDAIDHLKRIIIQKASNLNKPSKRRIPRGFPQSQTICLLDIVLWLLQQCGLPQTDCRHKAMELFFELVPVLPEKKSPSAWVEELIKKESVSFLIQRFEGAGSLDGNRCGIFYITTLQDLDKTSLRAVIQWMDMLLAALDCYNTFVGMRVVKPQTLLDPSQKSSFLRALHFFISHLSMNDVMAAGTCFKASLFSPQEKEEYSYNKCTIIVRIIEFVTLILDNCQQDFWKNLEDELLNNSMWELAAVTICDPLSIGFNTADVQVMKNLPDVCVQLLKAVAKSPYRRILEMCLQKKMTIERIEDLCTVNLCDPDIRHQSVKLGATLSACNQLYRAQLLTSVLHTQVTGLGFTVGSKLLSVVYKGIAAGNDRKSLPSLDIGSKRLAEGILQLAFNFGGQCEELISLLLNTVVLTVPLSGSSQRNFINFSHGEYFYSLFSETINRELLKNLDTVVPHLLNSSTENPKMVSSVLNGMLDQSFRQRSVQKQQGTQLVNTVLKNWMKLESWWAADSSPESKMAVLTLLAKVLQIESTVSCDTNHPAFNDIFRTYLSILLDQKLGLNLKSQAIIILPFFTNLKEERLRELKHSLDQFVAFNFPMKSDEFPKGTLKFNNYVDCVKKFLDALELSQSPVLLQLMAEILCRDNKHFMEDLFQNTFKQVVKRSSCDKQVILLDTLHNMFKSEDLLSNTTRHSLVDHCLLTLLWNCSSEALKDFFSKIINFSMDFLKSRFTKTSEAVFDTQLTKKMGYYKMLEVLFSRLSKDEIYSKESRINHAFEGSVNVEGKQLTRTLIKSCYDAYTENMSGETQLLEKRRLYHCAAYNCAIAVGSCTFTESKFYYAFLFSEKKEKNIFILENIIDLKRHYSFPIEVEVPMERKKKYLAIRKEAREAANEDSDEPQYLSSQSYMADSSLSEEMSQFDFSTGIQSFSYSSQDPVKSQRRRRVRDRSSEVQQTAEDFMEFEMDELNQHESMAPMTGLIKRMRQNDITPKVEEGTVPQDLPPWMAFLHSKLGNTSTPLNIRLFISKLVVNTEEVFRPYAKFWIGPLLQLIVSGNNGGTGIHYLVVETVVTLLSWSSVATPNGLAKEEILANRLLEFMMKNSFHEKRAVYRHNLEIIKTLLECWKDCLCIPYKLIFDDFSGTDPDKKDNSVGIQLLGLVVANNFSPYDPKCEIDINRYFQALANNVTYTRFKEVYAAAAEVLGLVLRYIAEKEKNVEGPVFSYVEKNLKSLHASNKEDKFIMCLNKIVKNCPLFADRFMNIVLYQLPKLHGVLKTQCLEIIMSRTEEIPDIFLELKNRDFKQIMSNRDDERQRVCLDIVYKLLAKLKPSELRELLPSVTAFSSHKFPVCRERMYDILMWIYDNYRDLESQSDSDSQEVFNMAKEALLEGLVDENAELQLIVRNFWSSEPRLPTGTMDRMVTILCSLCSTKIEKHFLSLATNLLLEMTSRSPDYVRQMFEHPLSECMFQDYTVDSNWRYRSTILTPMFVETQASQSIYRSRTQSFQEGQEPEAGRVRATQQHFQFTPTQNIGGRSSFNWLTGNSLDTLGSYSADSSESLSTALLFTSRRSEKAQRGSFKPLGPNFGKRRLGLPGDETDSKTKGIDERSDILRLRRRFLKDQEKLSIIYAKKGVAEQKREKEIKVEQKMKKDAQVILYRSYRHGDLPDIQIAHSALIAPLQALAQKDSTLAKQLFSALFSGILERIGSVTEKNSIAAKLVDKFNQYLNNTMYYFPPFIGCIQDMCYHHVELLNLNPASVSTSSIESLQQSIGILLLEKALQYISPPEEPPAKKMRGRANPPLDVQRWIQLAQLYRSIGDYDVLRGIFSNKIGTKSITQLALNAEARSEYGEAAKLYDKALQETFPDGEPSDAEKDFWEIASMDCYNHLTEWEPLEYCSTVNIDSQKPPDLKKMWSDPFYLETYLPHMIRSKVKLLLNGKADQSLLTFIDDAMKIEQRKVLIENFYSQELSLLYILQDDFDRARYYIKNGIDMFIQNYSSVDSLLYHSRLTELQTVQALTETQDFINFIRVPGNLSSLPSLRRLFHLWMSRYPDDKMDPMHIWDDVISNRCFFLDKIKEKLSCQLVDESMEIDCTTEDSEQVYANKQEDVNFLIRKCKFVMKMKMIDSARKQNNFSVAMKLLKELHRESKTNEDWLVKWVHSYCRYSHSRIQSQSNPERILTVLKTVSLLEESSPEYLNRFPQSYRYHNMLLGSTYNIMADALSKQPDCLDKIEESKARKVRELAGSAEEVAAGLYRKCLHYLKSAVRRAEEEGQSHSEEKTDNKGAIKAYMTLVDFCDTHLRKLEDKSSVLDVKDWKPFPEIIVDKMIKALKLGSKEARLKFPRLLQIIELYPNETLDLMTREVSSVPCWLFIGWISQMMAMLDKKESLAVQFIIEEIADYYPQSLVYPFMISGENYNFEDTVDGHKNKLFVEKIQSKLDKNGLIKDFILALEQLSNPALVLQDWKEEVDKEFARAKPNRNKIKNMYTEMYAKLGNSKDPNFGAFRRRFAEKYSKEFDKVCGKDGSLLREMKAKVFAENFKTVVDKIKREQGAEPGNLKEYSPWMSAFKPEFSRDDLEIPGQYDGKGKPMPEYHIKICGFDERVKVMSSIRKPKRIIIRGNDERDYPFLVKGGEDLRQDQRIEQLFDIMNIILSQDAACKQRYMQVKTYQVIPMTTRIGMIEWLENTCTLKEFISSTLTESERRDFNGKSSPGEHYRAWLGKKDRIGSPQQHIDAYSKMGRDSTISSFREREALVPGDLLRRAFVKMSATPEAFLALRSHFIRSHALLCISHWILGIGDRHLSNFMVNMETGGMIGIDFGHAFGTATQFLHVPELMPFRLTRQIINLMLPLKETGLFDSVMVHALRAYRTNPDLLISTMDVFVKEPSLDWKNFEAKQLKKKGDWVKDVNTASQDWYPIQKIRCAKRKLSGANPAVITCEELRLGHAVSKSFKHFCDVAKGDKEYNIRAGVPDDELSEEIQVKCLIDQATDPNILGRVWIGWEPWM